MQRVGLIVNPRAGRVARTRSRVDGLTPILRGRGFDFEVYETTADPDSARDLAAHAAKTCETVIACGGDGTVHGVVQGIAGGGAVLGVLPFGTANALARTLGLPTDPVQALERLLGYRARSIPLGFAESPYGSRWFTVMAGAGPDGTLVHEMSPVAKGAMGRGAYYAEAARLFLTRRFPGFQVEYLPVGSTAWESLPAVAMMASRVPDLGGLFSGLTAGSRLHDPYLVVQVLAAPAHLAFPAWLAFGRCGLDRTNPWLKTLKVDQVRCVKLPSPGEIHTQVDGEAMGVLPMAIRVVPGALRLLMPL